MYRKNNSGSCALHVPFQEKLFGVSLVAERPARAPPTVRMAALRTKADDSCRAVVHGRVRDEKAGTAVGRRLTAAGVQQRSERLLPGEPALVVVVLAALGCAVRPGLAASSRALHSRLQLQLVNSPPFPANQTLVGLVCHFPRVSNNVGSFRPASLHREADTGALLYGAPSLRRLFNLGGLGGGSEYGGKLGVRLVTLTA